MSDLKAVLKLIQCLEWYVILDEHNPDEEYDKLRIGCYNQAVKLLNEIYGEEVHTLRNLEGI